MAGSDLDVVRLAVSEQIGFNTCRSKLAEVVEKVMKEEAAQLLIGFMSFMLFMVG
jgi:hypothetical protein